jgi:hypothetical protein
MERHVKKRLIRTTTGNNQNLSLSAQTGEHCPGSGWWTAQDPAAAAAAVYVAEGSLMPAAHGVPTLWRLMITDAPVEATVRVGEGWQPSTRPTNFQIV